MIILPLPETMAALKKNTIQKIIGKKVIFVCLTLNKHNIFLKKIHIKINF